MILENIANMRKLNSIVALLCISCNLINRNLEAFFKINLHQKNTLASGNFQCRVRGIICRFFANQSRECISNA